MIIILALVVLIFLVFRKPKEDKLTMRILGYGGTTIYSSQAEEDRYTRKFRIERIHERLDEGVSPKVEANLRAELGRLGCTESYHAHPTAAALSKRKSRLEQIKKRFDAGHISIEQMAAFKKEIEDMESI